MTSPRLDSMQNERETKGAGTIEAPAVVTRNSRITPDDIVRFYQGRPKTRKQRFTGTLRCDQWTLTNTAQGLGDAVILTDIGRAAAQAGLVGTSWMPTELFRSLSGFNPHHRDFQHPFWVSLCSMQAAWDIGPGHNIQRARRIFGLPISPLPQGCIVPEHRLGRKIEKPLRTRISLHFEAGIHAKWQREHLHPRARTLYREHFPIIWAFIENHPEVDFIEIGSTPIFPPERVRQIGRPPIDSLISEMAACSVHIGITSGPLHVATALGVRCINIINFPAPWELMLPSIENVDVVESEWLYPQHHILHQDHDSRHWPKLSLASLERAYDGRVFPYEDPTKFLEMVSA